MLGINNEEIVLRNTYINALLLPELAHEPKNNKKVNTVKWADSEENKVIATIIENKPINDTSLKAIGDVKTIMKKEATEIQVISNNDMFFNALNGDSKLKCKSIDKGTRKIQTAMFPNVINNIIIQNPQKVEVNTFISHFNNKKVKPKKV